MINNSTKTFSFEYDNEKTIKEILLKKYYLFKDLTSFCLFSPK